VNRIRDALRGRDDFFLLRVVGGSTAAGLAIVSVAVDGVTGDFLLLAGLAAVVFAFPWHRLSALKAGPFELSLERGQIRGAIDSIEIGGVEKERVDETLARLTTDIERARGSRVLWVDDDPHRVVGERRLLRSLEIETVTVATCRDAARRLFRDNDFDLVITSLVKQGEIEEMRDHPRNPGITFVQWLRGEDDESIRELIDDPQIPVKDPVIKNLAVLFYVALPPSDIRRNIRPLTGLEPEADVASSLDELLKKGIRLLADLRSNPIEVTPRKRAPTI
jgi:CheY-like chemotaxis protein